MIKLSKSLLGVLLPVLAACSSMDGTNMDGTNMDGTNMDGTNMDGTNMEANYETCSSTDCQTLDSLSNTLTASISNIEVGETLSYSLAGAALKLEDVSQLTIESEEEIERVSENSSNGSRTITDVTNSATEEIFSTSFTNGIIVGDPDFGYNILGRYEYVESIYITGKGDDDMLGNTDDPILYRGYLGIITEADSMPTAGSATYNAEWVGQSGQTDYFGTGSFVANFATGETSSLTLNYPVFSGGGATTAQFASITGLEISGNTFSSGTNTTFSVLGTTYTDSGNWAGGHFFGWDAEVVSATSGGPDEIGGTLRVISNGNTVAWAGFIADSD